jgi:hypothetical protein
MVGPDSIDQKRFINAAAETDCAKDNSEENECDGRHDREN